MTGPILANIRELGLVSLVLATLAIPALVTSGNGVRPFDVAYLLTSGK